jgi:hypothetical protein
VGNALGLHPADCHDLSTSIFNQKFSTICFVRGLISPSIVRLKNQIACGFLFLGLYQSHEKAFAHAAFCMGYIASSQMSLNSLLPKCLLYPESSISPSIWFELFHFQIYSQTAHMLLAVAVLCASII